MKNRVKTALGAITLMPALLAISLAGATDVVTTKLMTLELAHDIAQGAIDACRKGGYQVSVVVTDRSGEPLVVMRDVYSNKFFTQLAHGKANAVVLSSTSSGALRNNRSDIVNELNHLEGVLVLAGGLPIETAGSIIGAVGVSGAPAADKDEACAQHGIDAVQERLDFAD
ncbi:MAG: heme-binding protein [Pseudomonadota bacterium]|nr:heme-binding protein [Pseudomonadota bacterium]